MPDSVNGPAATKVRFRFWRPLIAAIALLTVAGAATGWWWASMSNTAVPGAVHDLESPLAIAWTVDYPSVTGYEGNQSHTAIGEDAVMIIWEYDDESFAYEDRAEPPELPIPAALIDLTDGSTVWSVDLSTLVPDLDPLWSVRAVDVGEKVIALVASDERENAGINPSESDLLITVDAKTGALVEFVEIGQPLVMMVADPVSGLIAVETRGITVYDTAALSEGSVWSVTDGGLFDVGEGFLWTLGGKLFRMADGTAPDWAPQTDGQTYGAADGVIVVSSNYGTSAPISAFATDNGTRLWTKPATEANVTVDASATYIASGAMSDDNEDGYTTVTKLDTLSGKELWTAGGQGLFSGESTAHDTSSVWSVDGDWEILSPSGESVSVTAGANTLTTGSANIYMDFDGALHTIDPGTGASVGEMPLGDKSIRSFGSFLVLQDSGALYGLR